jgi:hypothetical protein
VDIDTEALATTVSDARVSAVVRCADAVNCSRCALCADALARAQPTFAFHKDGKSVGEIRGADAEGVKAAVAALKDS